MNKNLKYYFFPVALILILSFSRVIPHPSNFTPVLAIGIFSGFYFRQLYLSLFIVIFAMFLGDLYLGFHNTMLFTYISLVIAVISGLFIKKFKVSEILYTGLASSAAFFIITNFGAWLTLEMYEKNFVGLLNSYTLAIPFFHNTLISTFIYLFMFKILFEVFMSKKFEKYV
tara:strand:- start:1339 stop:1851 length:513 start_codon:yes stop_codon:yes gene_type:complete